jgi:glutathione S-transferase
MRLRTAKASPFGRKVWMSALRLGLMNRIALVEVDLADPKDPLQTENPLRKMPVLTSEEGEYLFDSPVIIEYLDHISGGRLVPQPWTARLSALKMQALCDGVMDAGALIVMEGRVRPPALHYKPWLDAQRSKIVRALSAIELSTPNLSVVYIDSIALACALGFLDRRRQYDWRAPHPHLVHWLEQFRAVAPEYDQTHVAPEPDYVPP